MATIRERTGVKGKSYQVRYRIDEKEKSETFESKREANRFKKEIEAKLNLGLARDESTMKFSEYAEMVFKIRDRKAAFVTKQNRGYTLSAINEHLGNIKLKDLSATRIENFFAEMSETKSDQVLTKYKQILNIVLDFAFSKDLIVSNPMLKVKFDISQQNLKQIKPIDINVFKNYINYAKIVRKYYFGLLLMLYTGVRVGELLALRLDDFDFNKNLIYIIKSRQRNGIIGPVKKGRNRTIPIHEKTSELYCEVEMYHNNNKRLLKEEYQDNQLFIANDDGTYVSYNGFRMHLSRLDKKIGVTLRPHQLRHTFSTFLRGMEIKDIQKMTGHKDMDTLVNIYQDHDGYKDKTIEDLDTLFKNI